MAERDLVALLQSAIEHAPASGPTAPGLVGLWVGEVFEEFYVCAPCVGRIIARGMGHLLKGGTQVWTDSQEPICPGKCCTCAN